MNDGNTQLNDSDRLFQGQVGYVLNSSIDGSNLSDAGTVELHDADGNWVRDLDVKEASSDKADNVDFLNEGEQYIEVSTEILDGSSYNVTDEQKINIAFDVSTHTLTTEFSSDSVTNKGSVDLTVDSERSGITTEVSAEGLNHEDLWNIFGNSSAELNNSNVNDSDSVVYVDAEENSIVLNGREDFEADFTGIAAGEYQFTSSVTDTTAEDTATIQVTEAGDTDYAITNVEQVESGDIAEITVALEETQDATVVLGSEDTDYATAVNLTGVENDEITLTFNTHEAGNSPWGVAGDDSDDAIDSSNVYNDELQDDPLPEYNWRLAIGDELTSDFDETDLSTYKLNQEYDRDALVVQSHSGFGDVTTYTAPADQSIENLEDFNEYATATDTIAENDSLLLTLEDFGAEGALEDITNDYQQDFILEITQTESGVISDDTTEFNSSNGSLDLELVTTSSENYEGDLVFLVSGDNLESYENLNYENAEFETTFTVNDSNEYVAEDEDIEYDVALDFEQRTLEWDDIDSLPAKDGAQASGTTNVAPGTEINTEVDSDEGGFVDLSDAVVAADGTFTTEFDLAGETPGVHFKMTATDTVDEDNTAVAEDVTLEAASDDEPETDVDVSAEYDSPITTEESTDISAVVTNNGDTAQTVDVELTFNGEVYTEEGVEVGANSSETVTLTTVNGEDLDAGDYDLTISVSNENVDASADGTLTVEDASENGEENGDENGAENGDENGNENGTENGDENGTENGDENGTENGNENGDENGGEDDGEDDGTPGFGIAVALVAMLAAAMLALRRQN
ncbi:PGF-CTERM sorting domain-containing protein [Haloterrigena sp. SYSU A121-1]|uniref:PGF-CTERM sorting domain-containing protein n=1 Tax=Haloterrigena gelatinilytica TaxID=2741724 RepID=A0A8J8GNZ9_9EURY|nr:BGTF surface domain-containing protein [Haloterrigena gelatinilytica]NUB92688.1 PGF-CTERM sorting domain-containing protein [Haloterrigena gelatinilytica]